MRVFRPLSVRAKRSNPVQGAWKTRACFVAALLATAIASAAHAATDLDLFFPVPVQGKLASEMTRLIAQFDQEHPDINVTAVYTGSYDDTNLKTRAAVQAGRPPGAVIMSANFVHTRSTTMRSHWIISSLG